MTVSIRLPFSGNYPVTQGFGENPEVYARFKKPGHNGVDFALPVGTPVLAAASGKAIKVGNDSSGYGNYILLQHDGFQTLYAHLSSIDVLVGTSVTEGKKIGLSGSTGFSTGPHLHFELRIPGFPGAYSSGEVNPLQFLKAVTVSGSQSGDLATVEAGWNIRTGPGIEFPSIGITKSVEGVKIVERKNDWIKLEVWLNEKSIR